MADTQPQPTAPEMWASIGTVRRFYLITTHIRVGDPAGPSKSELKKRAKQLEKDKKAAEKAAKQQELASQKAMAEVVRFTILYTHPDLDSTHLTMNWQDFAAKFYGPLPLNQSQSRPRRNHALISSLSSRDGETVLLRARLQTSRAQGNKMVFLNLRQRTDSVQALLTVTPEKVSKQMVKWAASLADESIVLVEGVVRKSPEIIKSASVGDIEVHVTQVTLQTW
jgi:Aspartyl/asparaginyl-tRNA synthetases